MNKAFNCMLTTLLLASVAISNAVAVVPLGGGPITYNRVPVNITPGEQYDPHDDQDSASYSGWVGFDQSC
jgi:hypothetical protein